MDDERKKKLANKIKQEKQRRKTLRAGPFPSASDIESSLSPSKRFAEGSPGSPPRNLDASNEGARNSGRLKKPPPEKKEERV